MTPARESQTFIYKLLYDLGFLKKERRGNANYKNIGYELYIEDRENAKKKTDSGLQHTLKAAHCAKNRPNQHIDVKNLESEISEIVTEESESNDRVSEFSDPFYVENLFSGLQNNPEIQNMPDYDLEDENFSEFRTFSAFSNQEVDFNIKDAIGKNISRIYDIYTGIGSDKPKHKPLISQAKQSKQVVSAYSKVDTKLGMITEVDEEEVKLD